MMGTTDARALDAENTKLAAANKALRASLKPCATAMASIEENKWLDSGGTSSRTGPLFLAAVELELELEETAAMGAR